MGQQQLLLLVLGIVIVGLAVVVGIEAFSKNGAQAERDAIAMDLNRFAAEGHAWVLTPNVMGGGESSPTNLDMGDLGYDLNENMRYEDGDILYKTGYYSASSSVVSEACDQGKAKWSYVEVSIIDGSVQRGDWTDYPDCEQF